MKKNGKKIILLSCTLVLFALLAFAACQNRDTTEISEKNESSPILRDSLKLRYANQFSVDYYTGGYTHIHIEDGNEYVLVPEGAPDKDLGIEGVTYIHMPSDAIYLAASSAMDFFGQLAALERIVACSTKAEDYSLEQVKERIDSGKIAYVGKYSAPEYETILDLGCDLAIESTMIYHSPKIKEQLEELGVPVLVERSSYETDPLGRLEWVKLYGVLLQKETEAEEFFEKQCERVEELRSALAEDIGADSKKTVAFFYIASNGYVNVRKPGDYLCKMIGMAGGTYAFSDIQPEEENALSTININWEDFYKEAVDADILIYNGTIDGGVLSLEGLLEKNALFQNFKAVRDNNVWCTNANLYQESSKVAEIIGELYRVIRGEDAVDMDFIYRLD